MSGNLWTPADIRFGAGLPFVGLLGRSELEAAAALIVRICQRSGGVFRPLVPKEIEDAINADVREDVSPFSELIANPFWRPDFRGLVDAGFADFIGTKNPRPISLTVKFFDRLNRIGVSRE